jgi:predicted NBD/HSP70 family sugar kinase
MAVDVGGTKMAAAVVDAEGTVLSSATTPTPREPDAEAVFAALLDAVRRARGEATPLAAGVGCAGAHGGRGRHGVAAQHRGLAASSRCSTGSPPRRACR